MTCWGEHTASLSLGDGPVTAPRAAGKTRLDGVQKQAPT